MEDTITGSLFGTAVGDSVGLCCEGLSRSRQKRLFAELDGPRFLFGRGMVSDDTEHACLTARAVLTSGGEIEVFTRALAWQMRGWFLGLPAGIGLATLKACVKLCLGFSARRSGVFSAGNGPAMRSPILGLCFGDDPAKLREVVRVSTRLTHTDSKAEYGALAVAWATYYASQQTSGQISPRDYYEELETLLGPEASELLGLIQKAVTSVEAGRSTDDFACELGLEAGISGYMYHTVPVVLHSWFRHPGDLRAAILEIVRCGGDTDTTAAILGGIIGAGVGKEGVPTDWLEAIWEWPRSTKWIEELGRRLAEALRVGEVQSTPAVFWPWVLLRNLFFAAVVLAHGFRRLLPPY